MHTIKRHIDSIPTTLVLVALTVIWRRLKSHDLLPSLPGIPGAVYGLALLSGIKRLAVLRADREINQGEYAVAAAALGVLALGVAYVGLIWLT